MKKFHFIAWERAREKGALRCTGKNERKKVALRCSGQSGRESCAGQGKREPRPAAANATERLAAPGGCECHREIAQKLRNLLLRQLFLWTCVPKPRPSLWVEVDFHLIRGFLEVANFESRIPRKLTRNHCRIPRGCKF